MSTRIVTGTILNALGQPWVGFPITFTVQPTQHDTAAHYPVRSVDVVTDETGRYEAELNTGVTYAVMFARDLVCDITVPDGSLPITLEELRGGA